MEDTIVALSTPEGTGAIAVIRLSGPTAIMIADAVFYGKNLSQQASHTLHYGTIRDKQEIIDEVVVSLYVAPHSFTGEDVVEISCHGSPFIVQKIIQLLLKEGARLAGPGEFTQRAFLNGRMDLAQAEAVADLIASESEAAHRMALQQMRGGFSQEIKALREQLVHFASMIELELDFGEENVEFASREALEQLVYQILAVIDPLLESFAVGNVIKNGVPTVIAGKPNTGKSTLLNALLNEEKAIVSDIPGTTRDFIEDEITLNGVRFRFIDTAGLRDTIDPVEAIGVARTREKIEQASLILYLFDLQQDNTSDINQELKTLRSLSVPFIIVGNKVDQAQPAVVAALSGGKNAVMISAQRKENLNTLRQKITEVTQLQKISAGENIITNARHYQSLSQTRVALLGVLEGLRLSITHDLLAQDIRHALYHLGEITGQISNDELLGNIFSKFCIGK